MNDSIWETPCVNVPFKALRSLEVEQLPVGIKEKRSNVFVG